MACDATYSCLVQQIGSLHYHNVLINGDRWNYPENSTEPSSEEEILKLIKDANCSEGELTTQGFVKGWTKDCPK